MPSTAVTVLTSFGSAIIGGGIASMLSSRRARQRRMREIVYVPMLDELKQSSSGNLPVNEEGPPSVWESIDEVSKAMLYDRYREDLNEYAENVARLSDIHVEMRNRELQYANGPSFCKEGSDTVRVAIGRNPAAHESDPVQYRFLWTSIEEFAINIWPAINEANQRRTNHEPITQHLEDCIREFDYPAENADIPAAWKPLSDDWVNALRGMVSFGGLKKYKELVEEKNELRKETINLSNKLYDGIADISTRRYWRPRIFHS